ncbi:hypothetical protein SOPP22_10140 [Shewanella sp. OPT22]|nr:hypothetical protein SOPP22_10140 [Shewanella sp. OPT22]
MNLFSTLFLAVSFLIASTSYAQDSNTVEQKLELLRQAVTTDTSQADELIKELELITNELSIEQQGKLFIWKAVYFIYLGDHELAIKLLKSAERLAISIELESLVYRFQMTNYLALDEYGNALKAAKKQIKVIDHLVDPSNQRDVYIRMANFYYNLGAYPSSQRYVHKALHLVDDPVTRQVCFLKVLESANAFEIKANENFKELASETLALCKEAKEDFGTSLTYRTLGRIYIEESLFAEAEVAILQSLDYLKSLNVSSIIASNHYFLSKIYFAQKKFDKAKDFATNVTGIEDDSQIHNAKKGTYKILSDLHYQEGQYKEAFEAAKKAQIYQQKIYDDEKIKTLAYEAAKFDFEELEDFIQKNENTEYISSGRELRQIDKEMELLYDNKILKIIMILCGTTVFTSVYMGICSYRRNRYNPLTGLLRHDAASKMSKDLFHDAMYRANGFAVLAVDIDKLKDFNRILGHEHADWVIIQIATAIKKLSRFKKAKGSYSGNGRFYVYLELNRNNDAIHLAQSLQEEVHNCNTFETREHFNMTVSIGVACLMQRTPEINDAEVRRQADVALQVAKDDGGDEIIKYQSSFDAADEEHKKQMRFVHFIDPKLMVRGRRF